MRITKSDFNNWWQGPAGVEVRKMLEARKIKIAILTVGGALSNVQQSNLSEQYGRVVGRCEEIDNLLEMSFDELMGDKE